jgi:hypothetical protein
MSNVLKSFFIESAVFLAVISPITVMSLVAPSAFASDSRSLSELRLVEDKFRNLTPKEAADDLKRADLLDEASAALSRLTKTPDVPLDTLEVREVVELLKVTEKYDKGDSVLDLNYRIIKANERELREALKNIPPKQAKAILDEIDVVLSESSDPAVLVKPPRATKAK